MCKRVEHSTRDCEEQGDENGAILAKLNVPANSEVGLMAVMIGAELGDGKDKWACGRWNCG